MKKLLAFIVVFVVSARAFGWNEKGHLVTAPLAGQADALLDASCDDEELLAHCRRAAPHVRGCWAVGHILAQE